MGWGWLGRQDLGGASGQELMWTVRRIGEEHTGRLSRAQTWARARPAWRRVIPSLKVSVLPLQERDGQASRSWCNIRGEGK